MSQRPGHPKSRTGWAAKVVHSLAVWLMQKSAVLKVSLTLQIRFRPGPHPAYHAKSRNKSACEQVN
jgi:hypothetical protein